jgi:hypothetical protein
MRGGGPSFASVLARERNLLACGSIGTRPPSIGSLDRLNGIAQRVFLWLLADERAQLELFRERVAPLVAAD